MVLCDFCLDCFIFLTLEESSDARDFCLDCFIFQTLEESSDASDTTFFSSSCIGSFKGIKEHP